MRKIVQIKFVCVLCLFRIYILNFVCAEVCVCAVLSSTNIF